MLKGELDEADHSAEGAAAPAQESDVPAGAWGSDCMTVRVFFEDGCKMENLRALMLLNNVKEEAEVLEYIPNDIESNQDSSNVIIDHGFIMTFRAHDNNAILRMIGESINIQSYEIISNDHKNEKKGGGSRCRGSGGGKQGCRGEQVSRVRRRKQASACRKEKARKQARRKQVLRRRRKTEPDQRKSFKARSASRHCRRNHYDRIHGCLQSRAGGHAA